MWNKIFKVLLALALISFGGLFTAGILDYSRNCSELKDANWGLQQRLRGCQEASREYNIFQSVVEKVGKREYSENYDCLNHAKDLYEELRKEDIESVIFIREDRKHAWLGIYIETVGGNFISPSEDLKIIEIRDGDLKTICSCK